jgi:formylglycine-generating enzyme required for sulfatase activity
MANVPTIGGSSYCVDATEVTVSAYNAFLMTNPSTSLFPAVCSARTSFTPSQSLDLAHPNNPVNSVDWCQAYGYCAGSGRHLCGRIGGGASLSGSEGTDPIKSEWFNACSKGGTRSYPYGNLFMFSACSTNQIAAVQSASGCVGGYPGIYDMSGNVAEWEDDCQGTSGGNDMCATRGGSYSDNMLSCSGSVLKKRSSFSQSIGFRCCL